MDGLFGDAFAIRKRGEDESARKRRMLEAEFKDKWGIGVGTEVRLAMRDHQLDTDVKGFINDIRSPELVSVYFNEELGMGSVGGTWHVMNLRAWEGETPWKDGPIFREETS